MSTERVRIELTEEQREELLYFLGRTQNHDALALREIIAAAPTITFPNKSDDLLKAAKVVRDLCPLPPIGRADEWPKAWQRFCLAIVEAEEV